MKMLIAFIAMMLCAMPAWAEDISPIQTGQPPMPEQSVPPAPVYPLTTEEAGKIQLLESYAFIQSKEFRLAGNNMEMSAYHVQKVAEDIQSDLKEESSEPVPQYLETQNIAASTQETETDAPQSSRVSEEGVLKEQSETDEVSGDLVQFLSEKSSALQGEESDLLKHKTQELFLKTQRKKIRIEPIKQEPSESAVTFGSVDFTRQIRGTYSLIHPPERIHPWMKWLLYTSRIHPDMLRAYYEAVDKSEYLYRLAVKSKGKLKIRYRGQIMDVPVFIWPDQAEGKYELVQPLDTQIPPDTSSNPVFAIPARPN